MLRVWNLLGVQFYWSLLVVLETLLYDAIPSNAKH